MVEEEGEDDSLAEIFREWNAAKKVAKAERLKVFQEKIEPILGAYGLIKHSDFHYQLEVGTSRDRKDRLVDIWPSSGKWQHQGRIVTGNGTDLLNFLKKRGLNKQPTDYAALAPEPPINTGQNTSVRARARARANSGVEFNDNPQDDDPAF